MSRLILVRHGETVWHAENRYAGRSDIALTPRGLAQAQRLALWATAARLTSVWSSTLSRARFTAEPAASAAGLLLDTDERLVELNFGEAEGLTNLEMQLRFPVERAAFLRDPVLHALPGGESPTLAAARGLAALSEIAEQDGEDGRGLVVAHNTLLRLVLCRLLGIPLARYREVFPRWGNVTLTEIEFTQSGASLLSYNVPLPEPSRIVHNEA